MTRFPSLTAAIRTLLRTLVPASAAGMVALGVMTAVCPGTAHASSRIKDIVDVEGVRENMLIGYGLVVGLNGTGDSLVHAAGEDNLIVRRQADGRSSSIGMALPLCD
jgi:flagellar P-ring protein precursor FlgI